MSEAVCDPVAQQLAAMCRAHLTSSICVNCAVLNRALLSSACAHAHFAWYSFASTADTAISCGQDKRAEYLQKVIDLSPEIYGSYARDNAKCLAMSVVTMPFVKITQLCMVRVPLMCSPVFVRFACQSHGMARCFLRCHREQNNFCFRSMLFWSLLLLFVS